MTKETLPADDPWAAAGTAWMPDPAENAAPALALPDELFESQPHTFWTACGRGAACICGTAGGAAVSHIGCLVSPVLAFAGAASGASVSMVAAAASTVLTGVGLAAWYKLRGAVASPLEKRLTVAGALGGAGMMLGVHLSGALGGNHHDHNMDAALTWYRSQTPQLQTQMQENARALNTSLVQYVQQICGEPQAPTTQNMTQAAIPALDKP